MRRAAKKVHGCGRGKDAIQERRREKRRKCEWAEDAEMRQGGLGRREQASGLVLWLTKDIAEAAALCESVCDVTSFVSKGAEARIREGLHAAGAT